MSTKVPGVERDSVPTRYRYRIPDGTLMEQYGKAASGGSTQPLCSITGHKLGPLVANCHSIILRVLVCQSGIWGSSPLYVKNQLTSRFVESGAFVQGPVVGSRKPTTWLYRVVSVSKGMPSPLSDVTVCRTFRK